MFLLRRMRVNWRSGPRLRPGKISDVIEMPVREQNRFQTLGTEPLSLQPSANLPLLADQSRVDQYRFTMLVDEQMARAENAANRENSRRRLAHRA